VAITSSRVEIAAMPFGLTTPNLYRSQLPDLSADKGDEGTPPPSQSHFAKFEDFTPNDAAPFDDEFARLASSQQWVSGSQEYTRERTIAIKEELGRHYFSQPQQLDDIDEEELSEEEKALKGYQALCHEVGIDPSDSVEECQRNLKKTLVNIVDLSIRGERANESRCGIVLRSSEPIPSKTKRGLISRRRRGPRGTLLRCYNVYQSPDHVKAENATVPRSRRWCRAVLRSIGLRCKFISAGSLRAVCNLFADGVPLLALNADAV
jgi:hypothetical protein